MSESIHVAVDPTNPGQFFACCGLLELADRLWPGAEGCFAEGGREFRIACGGSVRELLTLLTKDLPTAIARVGCNGLGVPPIIAPLYFQFGEHVSMTLDAWMRIGLLKGVPQVMANPPWNFWSGQQTSLRIWTSLRAELLLQLRRLTDEDLTTLFDQRLFQKGRFGFDPGPAWNPLDVGFSPNEQSIEVESCPAVELLAAVGLQRFRPILNEGRDGFDYFLWHQPLPPSIAAPAMAGKLNPPAPRYRGSIVSRGQYGALGFSFLIKGDARE